MPEPDPRVIASLEGILGGPVHAFAPVHGGYTAAQRWTFGCGAARYFAKVGVTPLTAGLLRREIAVYGGLRGPFMPQVHGWDADAAQPVLVLEDLSGAQWPPPWQAGHVQAAREALRQLHGAQAALPTFEQVHAPWAANWAAVARDPAPFLALGLASDAWLAAALPALTEAEARCDPAGSAPCHWDVRSDNLCLKQGRVLLIDWAEACLSDPALDLGFWLPSLAHEGGPPPEALLPGRPDVAAWVSGYFAARAGLPPIADAPRVRTVQRAQLAQALPWAARALGLAEPRAASA